MSNNTTTQSSPTEAMTDSMLKNLLAEPKPELPEFLRLCQEPSAGYWDSALKACNGLQYYGAESEVQDQPELDERVMDPPVRYPGLPMMVPDRAPGLLMIRDPGQWPVAPEHRLQGPQDRNLGLLRVKNPGQWPLAPESGLPSPQNQSSSSCHGAGLQDEEQWPAPQPGVFQVPLGYPKAQNYGAPSTRFFRPHSNTLQSELQDMRTEFQHFQDQQNQKMEDLEVRYCGSKDRLELEQLQKEKEAWLQEREMLLNENERLAGALETESQEKRALEDSIQEYRWDADLDNDIRKDLENIVVRKDAQIKDLLEILESMGNAHREELQKLQDSLDLESKEKKALEARVLGSRAEIEELKSALAAGTEKLAAKILEFKKSKKQLEKKIGKLEKRIETADNEISHLEDVHVELLKAKQKQSIELRDTLKTTTEYLEQLVESRKENRDLKVLTTKLKEKLAEERRGKNQ